MIEDLKLVDEPIQSMGFRAPEVVLGLSLDERIDIFSLGAVLGEIYSGKQLFPVFDDFQLTRCLLSSLFPNWKCSGYISN